MQFWKFEYTIGIQTFKEALLHLVLFLLNRVLKWWRHKNEISGIMGFFRIFWKNIVQEAYLTKMSISGQIVSEIVA